MKRFGQYSVILATLLGICGPVPAFAAATLLPNGMQCFAAQTASSGGFAGFITLLGSITGGSGYVNGTYSNVPLTGGSGTGAIGIVTVAGGAVTNVALSNPGSHYVSTDVLSAANGNLGGSGSGFSVPVSAVQGSGTGMVGVLGTITGGSGGATGTYPNVALTGGMGSNATANITVSGGVVTAATVVNPGAQYSIGDVLSASSGSIGGVSGFSVPVNAISINGSLAGGKVYFYVPQTQTLKSTWFNADQASSHQNPNPVPLDANGCAVIYGVGSYRQVLQDSLGNTIWDQITTDTSANNNYFWAGLAGGTPNVIAITDPGFNATDGSQISFIAIATNTGATTLNPSAYGAYPILKATTAGLVSLTGGEIVQNNPVNVAFSSVNAAFLLLNPPIQSPAASSAPLCGAVGYTVVNDSGSPNTTLDLAAATSVAVSGTGQSINRSNVSVTINLAKNGVGGLDTGALAASTDYYIWLIDNGAAPAGLASLSSTAPVLPNGYSYQCRLSAVPTTSATILYQISTSGNTTMLFQAAVGTPFAVTGPIGTCATSFVATTFSLLPPTARLALGGFDVVGANSAGVARTANRDTVVFVGVSGITAEIPFQMPQVSQTLQVCASSGTTVFVYGWVDATNAN